MAVKYLTSLDLRTNELQYASIHPLTSAPTGLSAQLGQVYFNTLDDKLKIYTSNGWQTVGGVTSITAGSGIDVSSDPITGIFTVSHEDTSAVNDVTPSSKTYVSGLIFDTFGHVTGVSTDTETEYVFNAAVAGPFNDQASINFIDLETAGTQTVIIEGVTNETDVAVSGNTITIGLPNDVTIANDLTVNGSILVDGDMTVNGTVTTINTETINLADNVILLNSNLVGAPTTNAGIEINRGTSDNRSLIWDEAQGEWVIEVSTGQYYPIAYVSGPTSYATTIGSSTTSFVTHGLGTTDVAVQLYDLPSGETIIADVLRFDVNTIQVSFNTAPGAGTIRVLVSKIG